MRRIANKTRFSNIGHRYELILTLPIRASAQSIYEDHKTDAAIQTTLRYKLDPDVTVITVAHRLQTIMDVDKIVSSGLLLSISEATYWL